MPVTEQQQAIAYEMVRLYSEWSGGGLWNAEVDAICKKNKFFYLIGVLLDGGNTSAAQAWTGVFALKKRLWKQGVPFTPEALALLRPKVLKKLMAERPCVHHYHARMAGYIQDAAKKVVDVYEGDAKWVFHAFTAREVYFRLLKFKGIGDKKANMAVRLLVDELGVKYKDTEHINIPVDVQVERVFKRTGLVSGDAGREQIQRAASELNPGSPWALDYSWHLGYYWCTKKTAYCGGYPETDKWEALEPCPLRDICPKLGVEK